MLSEVGATLLNGGFKDIFHNGIAEHHTPELGVQSLPGVLIIEEEFSPLLVMKWYNLKALH